MVWASSMTVGLTKTAVIATNRRLDDAHAVTDVAARHDAQHHVARMPGRERRGAHNFTPGGPDAKMAFDGLTHERANVLFVHPRSTLSTIPTIAASTGAAFF